MNQVTQLHKESKLSKPITRRFKNIIRRISNGESYYTNYSPKISYAEINELSKLGFVLQVESLYGAEPKSPIIVYPLNKSEFDAKAKEIL